MRIFVTLVAVALAALSLQFAAGGVGTVQPAPAHEQGAAELAPATEKAPETGKPPAAPVHPFRESLYGVAVDDPYRYMESLGAEALDWIRGQGTYTRRLLDAVGPRAAFEQRLAAFGASFGAVEAPSFGTLPYQLYRGRLFYTEREPGSDNLDLFVQEGRGARRRLVDVGALRAGHGGKPYAINYFQASPDGTRVAVGISEGGSEEASIFVYDVQSGAQIAGPVDRAQYAQPSWTDDASRMFLMRLAAARPGDPPTAKYQNATVQVWDLKSDPRDVIGAAAGNAQRLNLTPAELPAVQLFPGAPDAVFDNINGVQNEQELWLAPVAQAAGPEAPWTLLAARSDDVTGFDVRGGEIFLLSHHDAPTFKVLALRAGQKLAQAQTLVPARPDRIIESVHAASDALYVLAREGVYSHLLRVAADRSVRDVPLPVKGYVSAAFSDPRSPGLTLTLESWAVPPTVLRYEPAGGRFTDQKLAARPRFDPAQFTVEDLTAGAGDGARVPLTLVRVKGGHRPQVVLMHAYGSYGISYLPEFSARMIALMQEGAALAVCHVRGGGELGEAWRLAGKDALKANTWKDLIACGEDLVRRGVTTPALLFIRGESAGGITVGRAITERPDLFAGAIDQVPAANPLRSEFSPNGPPNIPEFGTVTNEQGFRNLLAMDSCQAVKPGVRYPAVLITTGLNDPRVSPWEPAKFAARLQASDTRNPVLLRVEEEAGHGIGSTKTQKDQEFADIAAFMFWRAGRAGWAPQPPR